MTWHLRWRPPAEPAASYLESSQQGKCTPLVVVICRFGSSAATAGGPRLITQPANISSPALDPTGLSAIVLDPGALGATLTARPKLAFPKMAENRNGHIPDDDSRMKAFMQKALTWQSVVWGRFQELEVALIALGSSTLIPSTLETLLTVMSGSKTLTPVSTTGKCHVDTASSSALCLCSVFVTVKKSRVSPRPTTG